MGNCFCSPEQHLAPSVHGRLIVDDTTETTSEGLRIQLSAAAWAAHHPCEDAYCIQVQNRSIFVAMFDGIGGPEAAQVCKVNCRANPRLSELTWQQFSLKRLVCMEHIGECMASFPSLHAGKQRRCSESPDHELPPARSSVLRDLSHSPGWPARVHLDEAILPTSF